MIWIITSHEHVHEEACILTALLAAGATRILLRKPGWAAAQYAALLDALPPAYYSRLLIRDQPALAGVYGLAGVHWSREARRQVDEATSGRSPGARSSEDAWQQFNEAIADSPTGRHCSREVIQQFNEATANSPTGAHSSREAGQQFNEATSGGPAGTHCGEDAKQQFNQATSGDKTHSPTATRQMKPPMPYTSPENFKENSTGVHSMEEITSMSTRIHTLLLSPVFNSISKPGYQGRYRQPIAPSYQRRVLALGGVDHSNIHLVKQWHFDGAALLGAIWKTPASAVENYHRIQELWNKSDL